MSLARILTRALVGVSAPPVSVEVHLSGGLPGTSIVGLPEMAVREARDRVRAALINAQFEFPQRRITISLAPADLPKEWYFQKYSGTFCDKRMHLGVIGVFCYPAAECVGSTTGA